MPQAEHDYLQLRTRGVLAVAVSSSKPRRKPIRAHDAARENPA
jgi:hypothetical protein